MTDSTRTPPIIDITRLRSEDDGEPARACIDAMHAACLDTGFFVVIGHGLDDHIDGLFDAARSFFALPQARKELVPRVNRYGFVPHSDSAIDTSRQSDNTEYLDLGLFAEVAFPEIEGIDGCKDTDGFETTVRRYQRRALDVGAAILRALAIALDVEPDFFATRMVEPQCKLRFLHYPKIEPATDGTLPVPTHPHTDYGAITMLATDGVPGLEVKPIGSRWTPVEALAGSLIINLGDMLARWSNDVYRSTPHRVVGPASGDRLSIPFFINPDPSTIIECIPTCVTSDRPCRYEPVRAGDFLASRIDGSTEPYVDHFEGPSRRVTP